MHPAIAIAGAAGAAKLGQMLLSSKGHDAYVKSAYKSASRAADENTNVYVDYHHYNPSGSDGNTRALYSNPEHYPDLEVHSPPGQQNLIVEIEKADTLDSEARSQLEAFSNPGYKRILAVPSGSIEAAEAFVDDLDGEIAVTTPSDLGEFMA